MIGEVFTKIHLEYVVATTVRLRSRAPRRRGVHASSCSFTDATSPWRNIGRSQRAQPALLPGRVMTLSPGR